MDRWEGAFGLVEEFLRKETGLNPTALRQATEWIGIINDYISKFAEVIEQALKGVFEDDYRYLIFSYWSPYYHDTKLVTKNQKERIAASSPNAEGLSVWYNQKLKEKDAHSLLISELLCESKPEDPTPSPVSIVKTKSKYCGHIIDISSFVGVLKNIECNGEKSLWQVGCDLMGDRSLTNFHDEFSEKVYNPLVALLKSDTTDVFGLKYCLQNFKKEFVEGFGQNSQRKRGLIAQATNEKLLPVMLLCAFYDPNESSRLFVYTSVLPPGLTSSGLSVGLGRDITIGENALLQALVNQVCWFPALFENHELQNQQTEEIIQNATRAAVTALDGRNLSHNLGSHVLRWMEHESREQAQSLKAIRSSIRDSELKRLLAELTNSFKAQEDLYCHLRERMDLLAATAVHLPMWTATTSVKRLVEELRAAELLDSKEKDSAILRHIGHSEGVYYTDIVYDGEDAEIVIPGSQMGKQAFYGILENIARDAAKYADLRSGTLVLAHDLGGSGSWSRKPGFSDFKFFHLDADYDPNKRNEYKRILTEKFSDSSAENILVVLSVEDEEICSASRDLQIEELLSDTRFTVWKVKMLEKCHHQLCQAVRDLNKSLEGEDDDIINKKAKALERALLSISVEASEIPDEDLGNITEGQKQEIRDDLLRVTVYDDRGFFAHSGEEIKERIQGVKDKGLCDKAGLLHPDNWGIKERYIFATYLRGKSPHALLLPKGLRPKDSIKLPILDVIDYRGRLAWVFYLLKPKEVLIVSDKLQQTDIQASQRNRISIWTWEEFIHRQKSSLLRHYFIVLCPRDKGDLEIIEQEFDNWPYRLFIYNPNNSIELPAVVKNHCGELDDLNLSQLNIDEIYDKWIKFIASRQRQAAPKIISVTGNSYFTEECYKDGKFIKTLSGSRANWGGWSNVALFDRHGDLVKKVQEELSNKIIHYEPYLGEWAVENRAYFSDNPDKYYEQRYALQEAALIRILVVDERIDGSLDQIKEVFKGNELTWRELWKLKGIDVMGREYKGKGAENPDEKVILDLVKRAKDSGRAYDFVLIHQGILDKLYEQGTVAETKMNFIELLMNQLRENGNVWNILIHSGRGGIPDLPKEVKFIHLSSVEGWFSSNLSKAEVVEELMLVRNEKYEQSGNNM